MNKNDIKEFEEFIFRINTKREHRRGETDPYISEAMKIDILLYSSSLIARKKEEWANEILNIEIEKGETPEDKDYELAQLRFRAKIISLIQPKE